MFTKVAKAISMILPTYSYTLCTTLATIPYSLRYPLMLRNLITPSGITRRSGIVQGALNYLISQDRGSFALGRVAINSRIFWPPSLANILAHQSPSEWGHHGSCRIGRQRVPRQQYLSSTHYITYRYVLLSRPLILLSTTGYQISVVLLHIRHCVWRFWMVSAL
jgi:hypothetical protein